MSFDKQSNLIINNYSGKRAKMFASKIWKHNSKITNPAYENGAKQAYQLLRQSGSGRSEILRFPIDGKRLYQNWISPKYWSVKKAYLKLKINEKWITVADYNKIPTSVFVYAAPTNGEIKTNLVLSSSKNIKGNLVFGDPNDSNYKKIIENKGKGLVTDFAPNWKGVRSNKDFRDGHRWENSFLMEDKNKLTCFSLSRNQGKLIKKEIKKKGFIECAFKLEGYLGKGDLHCVTGSIIGTDKKNEEVIAMAHLYEVGANDNASGVGASIEAINIINKLIKQKKLPRPKRTIRVIFTFEIIGYLAYFSRKDRFNINYIAAVNPDMIGEDQDKCKSVLHICRSPESNACFAQPLMMSLIEKTCKNKIKYCEQKYMINDNVSADPIIGASCPVLLHRRDRFYHSNEDTPDKMSEKTLKSVGSAMAAYLYQAASLDKYKAEDMANICLDYSIKRLNSEIKQKADLKRIDYIYEIENQRLNSIERITGKDLSYEHQKLFEFYNKNRSFKKSEKEKNNSLQIIKRAEKLIPVRKVIGTFTMENVKPNQREKLMYSPSWSNKYNLPVFWADGKRSIFDIYKKVSFEWGKYDLKDLIEYFVFLNEYKLISIKEKK